MTNLIRSNYQSHPFHLVSPSPWPLFTSIALFALTTCDFFRSAGLVFINKKRGSDEQSTDKSQDKEIEDRQAKNILSDTLNKLNDLEQKKVPENMDKGKSVPSKDSQTAKDIELQYPDFFDEESGNSDNKKQGYDELKEYLQEELDALSGPKETSAMEGSIDRETKKPKPSTSDDSEAKEKPSDSSQAKEKPSTSDDSEAKEKPSDSSQAKEKPSSSDSSEAKNKGSLIDDWADPSNEFGDWTGGDD